jgi:5'-nucleotidase
MNVLVTNDDGIDAEGLLALRRALSMVPGIRLLVIAPDGNRSAMARMITTGRPLWVQETAFDDGSIGYATDGTPVDCVRFGQLGLVEDFEIDLIVSGINHGSNMGDDVTYSGTVAAAFEGIILGIPAIAVSQQSIEREMDFRFGRDFSFAAAADFTARIVAELDDVPLPRGTLLNINVPGGHPSGVEVTRLGKRIYNDELQLNEDAGDGRRRFWIYGADPGWHEEPGTDLAAVAGGRISVTPVHFDLTDVDSLDALEAHDLTRLLEPATRELR